MVDIKRLNYEALVLFREMVRRDKADACFRLGLDASAADALASTTLEELRRIADAGILLLAARFGKTRFWEDVIDAVREGEEGDVNVVQLQAALLAARGAS
jgi:flagellar transcriptional activator FlhD